MITPLTAPDMPLEGSAPLSSSCGAPAYRCPLSAAPLTLITLDDERAEALSPLHERAEALLITPEATLSYPLIEGVPHITVEHARGEGVPPSPVAAERHDEINEEVDLYDRLASRDQEVLEHAARRLLGARLTREASEGHTLPSFPEPVGLWVDSMGSADTQQAAYRHLAPLQGKSFLQLGGSGSHAIKALLAGARCAGLLSPSLGEVKLAYALAERFGVAERFFGVVGIGELIPFADASLERVYGGGCLHHTELKHSIPEVARVLKKGGRASFVDPQENPIYSTWSHLLGRARFCGEEDDTHDHPLDLDELKTLTDELFQGRELYASGGLARYGLLMIERTTERALPIPFAAALFKAERAALKTFKLSKLFGNVAVMLTR